MFKEIKLFFHSLISSGTISILFFSIENILGLITVNMFAGIVLI